MSLNSAMFVAVTGVQAYGNAMNVTSDNLANVNTIGFKGSNVVFSDILASHVANGSSTMQIGRGSLINGISPSFTQGSFETTGASTDMAIQGAGFFIVKSPKSDSGSFYTRAGNFIVNNEGQLVNNNNYKLQGYKITSAAGETTSRESSFSNIDISGVQSIPKSTEEFRVGMNLDATAETGATFSSSVNVYNAVGEESTITIEFTKSANTLEWDWNVTAPTGITVTGAGASGTMTFTDQGELATPATDLDITLTGFSSGAEPLTFDWNLVDDSSQEYKEITSYGSDSVTNSVIQDGYSTGVLRSISVDDTGIISGLFSNGQSKELWQVALADFQSPWGLSRQGNSLFSETANSGQPVTGVANVGSFGSITGSAVELSNVDIAEQFVDLIRNQKAFQANSRTISIVDEMTEEVINIIR
ncbi:MAG: flagellar hook protein FlgE [Nitrospinota bacterium]